MSAEPLLSHEESWRLLPWLVNGRLDGAARMSVERHVRGCEACARELSQQRRWCDELIAPERVSYAPGPSFRKLMERIDAADGASGARTGAPAPAARAAASRAAWRPPGLAWAASFVACVALGTFAVTAYRWSQPLYLTHTAAPAAPAGVLHLAFDRSLPIGDAERLLIASGARVVEGPDASGVFGVAPVALAATAEERDAQLRALAGRLRTERQVRWIEPLPRGP